MVGRDRPNILSSSTFTHVAESMHLYIHITRRNYSGSTWLQWSGGTDPIFFLPVPLHTSRKVCTSIFTLHEGTTPDLLGCNGREGPTQYSFFQYLYTRRGKYAPLYSHYTKELLRIYLVAMVGRDRPNILSSSTFTHV